MSVEDLSDVIFQLQSGTYTVTRSAPGVIGSDGRLVPGSQSTFSILASVQPMTGRDLLRLPEGQRTKENLKIWSQTQLFTSGAGQDPDTVAVDDADFQVQMCRRWGPNGNYWYAEASKVGRELGA